MRSSTLRTPQRDRLAKFRHRHIRKAGASQILAQGLGNGISRPPVTAALANAVPEGDLGMATALQRMTQQIGNSFGIAMMSAAYNDSGTAEAFIAPFAVGVVLALVNVVVAGFLRPDEDHGDRPVTAPAARQAEPAAATTQG